MSPQRSNSIAARAGMIAFLFNTAVSLAPGKTRSRSVHGHVVHSGEGFSFVKPVCSIVYARKYGASICSSYLDILVRDENLAQLRIGDEVKFHVEHIKIWDSATISHGVDVVQIIDPERGYCAVKRSLASDEDNGPPPKVQRISHPKVLPKKETVLESEGRILRMDGLDHMDVGGASAAPSLDKAAAKVEVEEWALEVVQDIGVPRDAVFSVDATEERVGTQNNVFINVCFKTNAIATCVVPMDMVQVRREDVLHSLQEKRKVLRCYGGDNIPFERSGRSPAGVNKGQQSRSGVALALGARHLREGTYYCQYSGNVQ